MDLLIWSQMKSPRYRSLSSWLREIFSEPVRKINLDAGLSCPNRDGSIGIGGCVYCNSAGSGTSAVTKGLSVSTQIDRGIDFLSKRYKAAKFIAYLQSFTNTYGDPDHLRQIYVEAIKRQEVVALAIGTRPDCLPEKIMQILREINQRKLVWLELGLQSAHDRTLNLINRGHSSRDFFDASQKALSSGILVVAHVILGLPGETLNDMLGTARVLAQSGIHGVKIHTLYVIAGTPLESMYRYGDYRPMSLEESVEATLSFLEVLPKDMVIHRLTSDPHRHQLVAPKWMLDRSSVRNYLNQEIERRDIYQGSKNDGK